VAPFFTWRAAATESFVTRRLLPGASSSRTRGWAATSGSPPRKKLSLSDARRPHGGHRPLVDDDEGRSPFRSRHFPRYIRLLDDGVVLN
jgi:hypothetical protein